MKTCKSCRKEIDDKAKKCPHCQTDQRNWFLRHPILSAILALIIIGMASGSGDKKNSDKSSSPTPSSTTNQEVAALPKIGEAVQDKDLSFTVKSIDTAATVGNSYTKKAAQGMFNIITLEIKNVGKETVSVDSSQFQLLDAQGNKFDRSVEGQTALGLSKGTVDLFLQQVQPSLSVTGNLVFDIPKDATGLKLVVKGGLFSSGKQIDLGK